MAAVLKYLADEVLYFLIVNVLRRQRLLRDPEVMTSYRELSKKAQKANNLGWRLSCLLGDQNRLFMYILLQAVFTVATMARTVPIFLSYDLHVIFQILKSFCIRMERRKLPTRSDATASHSQREEENRDAPY